MRESPTDYASVLSARDQTIEKSRNVVMGYAASQGHWNPASSLTALLRQMQREYEDRFLYELVQNAYDAHPPRPKARSRSCSMSAKLGSGFCNAFDLCALCAD